MKKDQMIRALRDPEFRATLSTNQRSALTGFGEIDMEDQTLKSIAGGNGPVPVASTPIFSCSSNPFYECS